MGKFIKEVATENWGVYYEPQLIPKWANIWIYGDQSFQGFYNITKSLSQSDC